MYKHPHYLCPNCLLSHEIELYVTPDNRQYYCIHCGMTFDVQPPILHAPISRGVAYLVALACIFGGLSMLWILFEIVWGILS